MSAYRIEQHYTLIKLPENPTGYATVDAAQAAAVSAVLSTVRWWPVGDAQKRPGLCMTIGQESAIMVCHVFGKVAK